MKKINKLNPILVPVALLLVSLVAVSGVFAKYAQTLKDDQSAVTAKTFYFESDYLTEDNHTYKLNSGTQSVSFELYNYENALRISEVDTVYTVVVTTDDTSFTMNGETVKEKSFTASGSVANDCEITLAGLEDGYDYKVSVTADGGYVKTLHATFLVGDTQDGFFMNVDASNDSYVLLTVWTENLTGTVTVSVPAGLIPDSTDPILAGIGNYTDGEYTAFEFSDAESFSDAFKSRSYRFFKAASYSTDEDFSVKLGDKDAVESNIP